MQKRPNKQTTLKFKLLATYQYLSQRKFTRFFLLFSKLLIWHIRFSLQPSPRASSPECSGSGARRGRRACNSTLGFEYLHQKSRCKMFIGGNDISNDITTLGMSFSMFVYIRACFLFALIGRNLTAQSKGSHGEIGGGNIIQILETLLQALLPFPTPPPEYPGEHAWGTKTTPFALHLGC